MPKTDDWFQVNFRVDPDDRKLLEKLQKHCGESFKLSGWLREVVREAAKKELSRA